ncbi:MAG: hypothetical protein QOE93_2212 [Actinomycetota bacterium]|nr:hypothetical protein [Actinomycetota bacterium]
MAGLSPVGRVFYPLAAMADAKRDRQRLARQAKIAAEQAARKRAARQRQAIIGGAIFAVLAAVVLIVNRGGDDKTVEAGATTTTPGATVTTAPTATLPGTPESAAGKPCVARSEELPPGAPEVDVEVGPPPTALVKKDITVGTGAPVPEGATVTVNYIGVSCSSGLIFDASYAHNPPDPATFPLSGVIPGWQQGIPGMNVGGTRLLGIPPGLAYENDGRPPDIAPQETLWFVIEVLDAKPAA